MKLFAGLLLMGASSLGIIFFENYRGEMISRPFLWHLGFVLLFFVGIVLLKGWIRGFTTKMETHASERIRQIQKESVRIDLDFDKCEFKSGTYYREINPETTHSYTILAPTVMGDGGPYTERTVNSYIVYTDERNGTLTRFVSESFPFEMTNLKYYVLQKKVALYVSRFDRNKYVFVLQK